MIVRRILINNCGPYLSDWEVELPEGVVAVVAEYEDASERSNRAGKSWLAVDAQTYALFGRFRGRTDDLVHRVARGREDGFVEVEVESSEGRRFVVRRGRDRSGAPIRLLDGAQIKDDDLEAVVRTEILGLSLEEFTLTNCFVQGRMHAFMEMTPAEKRRVVSPWFRTDRWVPRHDLARSRLTAARRLVRDLEREREDLADRVEPRLAEVGERLPGAERELAAARERVADVLRRRAALAAEVDADAERGRERSRLEREVARARTDVDDLRRAAERRRDEAADRLTDARRTLAEARGRAATIASLEREAALAADLRDSVAALREDLGNVRSSMREDERRRRDLLETYERITSERTGVCPILKQACDRVERDEDVVAEVKREGLRARRAIDRAGKRVDELEWRLGMTRSELAGAEEAAEEIAALRAGVSAEQAEHDLEVARREDESAEAALSAARLGRTEAGKRLKAALRALEALPEAADDGPAGRLAEVADALSEAEGARDEAERAVADLRALEAEARRGEARLEEIGDLLPGARADVERLAWAVYAFGATGIPSRELENAFGVAEDAMNAVLSDLGAPTRLRFSPSRELREWEPACLGCGESFAKGERTHRCPTCGLGRRRRRRDELRLEVLDGVEEASFELDSGGGKVLLSLGARLGLARLPGATRRVRCESAVIDEPDGALDPPNRAALHRLLRDRLPTLGIRQTILITHADVRDEFGSVVVVRRWPDEDRSGFWRE